MRIQISICYVRRSIIISGKLYTIVIGKHVPYTRHIASVRHVAVILAIYSMPLLYVVKSVLVYGMYISA